MYKNLVKSILKDIDETTGIVVVNANAIGNIDSDNDISMPGSFTKTIKENFIRLKWFLNHDSRQLLGVPIQAVETPEYLQITGRINLDKQIGRDTFSDYKLYAQFGRTLEHSIGVDAIKYVDDQNIRKVTEWKLWEYSTLTAWGANDRTGLVAMKEKNPLKAVEWMEIQLKHGDYSDEKFMSIETALDNLKSLLEPEQTTPEMQPIGLTDLADISTTFLKTLQSN